jgi:hypothetical protein
MYHLPHRDCYLSYSYHQENLLDSQSFRIPSATGRRVPTFAAIPSTCFFQSCAGADSTIPQHPPIAHRILCQEKRASTLPSLTKCKEGEAWPVPPSTRYRRRASGGTGHSRVSTRHTDISNQQLPSHLPPARLGMQLCTPRCAHLSPQIP